jgi:ABC-2 type transport system ATP-binding protein
MDTGLWKMGATTFTVLLKYFEVLSKEFKSDHITANISSLALKSLKYVTGKDINYYNEECLYFIDLCNKNPSCSEDIFSCNKDRGKILLLALRKFLLFQSSIINNASKIIKGEEIKYAMNTLFGIEKVNIVKESISWIESFLGATENEESSSEFEYTFLDFRAKKQKDNFVYAIEVKDVKKSYGSFVALKGVSLTMNRGEIFGLLGPNGAGKTSLIEIIEGIRPLDSGSVNVLGKDVKKDRKYIKEHTGIQLQTTGLYSSLTVVEMLSLYASFFKSHTSVNYILEKVDLANKSKQLIKSLSGGMYQRLSLAISIINNPQILFLDEPTTGLDPQAKRNIWDIIDTLKSDGKSVFLTTHYMEEAELICNRVAIIDDGKIIDIDEPNKLIKKYIGEKTIEISYEGSITKEELSAIPALMDYWSFQNKLILISSNESKTLMFLINNSWNSSKIKEITTRKGSLEDVFLKLTRKAVDK